VPVHVPVPHALPVTRSPPPPLCLAIAFLTTVACRTREDAARRAGQEAAIVALRACPENEVDHEACRTPVCRDRCAAFADSLALHEVCTARCLGQGTCDSAADCDPGFACIVIAPRLRRCGVRPDAAF
jgi:hypothetical protein